MLSCTGRRCEVRFPITAYSPLHNTQTTFSQYLKVCLAFSVGQRNDMTTRMSKTLKQKKVLWFFGAFRDICAFYMVAKGRSITFSEGEVDMDAAKTHVDRSGDSETNVHLGRCVVAKERSTGKVKVVTAKDVQVTKGTALPPESNEDVRPLVAGSLRPGAVAGLDGGKAFKS